MSRRHILAALSAALAVAAGVVLAVPVASASTDWASRMLRPGDAAIAVGPPAPFTDPRPALSPSVGAAASSPATPPPPPPTTPVPGRPASPPRPPSKPPATHPAGPATLAPTRHAAPVRVAIGGTRISGPIVPTGIDARTKEFAVPPDAGLVGWYEYGPRPGEAGSAVLAGHLDWKHHPGVFLRLTSVRKGAVVTVSFSDHSVRRFTVTDVRLVLKPQLPTATVFARTGSSVLRLITCGGEFDRASHHYKSNVLVTAVPRP